MPVKQRQERTSMSPSTLDVPEDAAYGKLADAGYVIATHLSHGDMHFALTHNGRAVLNSLND